MRMPSPSRSEPSPHARAHALALEHGWNAMAFQTLAPGFSYAFHGDTCVAYVDTGGAWVAAGAPMGREEELAGAVAAFVDAARRAGRRACFFGVEDRFLGASGDALERVQIGEQPVWNPEEWASAVRCHRGLREQLRRARAKDVVVRRAGDDEREALRGPMDRLRGRWLATRPMPPMGFVVTVPRALESISGERFVAWQGDRVIGVACVIPVPARRGWFLEHLLRDPHAPNGTVELLVHEVMRWAGERGSAWVTLGLAPLAGDVPRPLQIARRRLSWLYNFEGLRSFKAKLRPRDWVPVYLAFPTSTGAARSMVDALAAFAPGGMPQFGARVVLRGHPAILAALAALLVPWTAILASASSDVWFAGHAAAKWAWVAFDVALALGIVALLRRPSSWLAAVLASVVTLDATLTALEASAWNAPQLAWGPSVLVVALACGGPALAALALWGAFARLRHAG